MEDYARLLRRSGYSERFRHEVISDAVRGHQKLLHEVSEGKRPLNRPRGFHEEERRREKERKKVSAGTGGRREALKSGKAFSSFHQPRGVCLPRLSKIFAKRS